MEHSELQKHLDKYLHGELEAFFSRQLAEHLNACSDCQHRLEELKKLDSVLNQLEVVPAPVEFAQEVLNIIRENQNQSQPKENIFQRLLKPKPLAWATIAAMFLLLAVIIFNNKKSEAPQIVKPMPPVLKPGENHASIPENPSPSESLKKELNKKGTKPTPAETNKKTDKTQPMELVLSEVKDTVGVYTSAEGDYVFKTKKIPDWIKKPDAIYMLNKGGLNLVELKPSRLGADYQSLVLNDKNVLPVELIINPENYDQSLNLLKKLFARFKSRETYSLPDSNTTRVAGFIAQKKFPEFVSELQNLGTPLSQPFLLSGGGDLKIQISISN